MQNLENRPIVINTQNEISYESMNALLQIVYQDPEFVANIAAFHYKNLWIINLRETNDTESSN